MDKLFENAKSRSDRILAEKLRFLYQGVAAVPANLAVACIVALLLRKSYPVEFLRLWLASTLFVAGLRLIFQRRFTNAMAQGEVASRWAPYICVGSMISGLLWGVLCVALPIWGDAHDYVLLTLVGAGMTAGALTTIVAYLPAFLVYVGTFVLPLAAVSLANADPTIVANGGLMAVYALVVSFGARKLSGTVARTIELQVDNEALNKSLQQALIDRDAARREKWSTLGQLSHELRTPLNAIMGFSETMREEVFGPLGNRRYKEYANDIYGSGRQLLTLATEIVQLSQGESGALELKESVVDLFRIVDSCVDVLSPAAKEADLQLHTSISRSLPQLRADESKIRQMLFNLVNNAVKFTPPGGEIRIHIAQAGNGDIFVVVRDTGIGMTAEEIQIALQPFGRVASPLHSNKEGAGLGLPICKRMAELHGGSLMIESTPDQGTVCTVTLPASRVVVGAETDVPLERLAEPLAHVA
jgi:two-component system cell cycle sensor histidine kinase PleC